MRNIGRHHIWSRLVYILCTGYLLVACDKSAMPDVTEPVVDEPTVGYLSLKASIPQIETRATGTEIEYKEMIYNMGVYVFDENGRLIGQEFRERSEYYYPSSDVTKKYEKTYQIFPGEIHRIEVTSGTRDVYIVANVANETVFKNENNERFSTKDQFNKLTDSLLYQGEYMIRELNGGKYTPREDESPNSGYDLPDWEDHLTMFIAYEGLLFKEPDIPLREDDKIQYFMGYDNYTSISPYPIHEPVRTAETLEEIKSIELERLVARVAIKSIVFDLEAPGTGKVPLIFEDDKPTNNYEFELDSVFLLNVPVISAISTLSTMQVNQFGHGSENAFRLFEGSELFNLYPESTYDSKLDLCSGIVSNNEGNYDISEIQSGEGRLRSTPLWFYVFENKDQASQYPVCFVISVKFLYKYPGDELKERIYYYPVLLRNSPGDYSIKRNMQYQLNITIKGLAPHKGVISNEEIITGPNPDYLDVTTRMGENLFPWIGNYY